MTRDEIINLKVGDLLQETFDIEYKRSAPGRDGYAMAQADARFSEPRRVTEIIFRGVNMGGEAYVGFYTEFGTNATKSGSVTEGETRFRLVG